MVSIFDKVKQYNEISYDLPPYFPGEKENMQYVTVKGKYKMCYKLRINNQTSPYLVLLPSGPGGDHRVFEQHFSSQSSTYNIIYIDPLGCGQSDYTPIYDVQKYVYALETLRNELHVKKWVMVGWSFGAYIAHVYAVTCPQQTSHVVLINGVPAFLYQQQDMKRSLHNVKPQLPNEYITQEEIARWMQIQQELSNRVSWDVLEFNLYKNGYWKKQHTYQLSDNEILANMQMYNCDNAYRRQMWDNMMRGDECDGEWVGDVKTLVCESVHDMSWSDRKRICMKEYYKGCRYEEFDKCGHDLFQVEGDKFFKVLREFVM